MYVHPYNINAVFQAGCAVWVSRWYPGCGPSQIRCRTTAQHYNDDSWPFRVSRGNTDHRAQRHLGYGQKEADRRLALWPWSLPMSQVSTQWSCSTIYTKSLLTRVIGRSSTGVQDTCPPPPPPSPFSPFSLPFYAKYTDTEVDPRYGLVIPLDKVHRWTCQM